jgi:EAL domain-containing protein (putative c-di-GMP-specific phosphodiesterase class I)
VDLVKIDRAFVIDIENNNRSLVTLYYIFDVAKQLKRQVIAEGIETKAQFELIRELNCEGAQGYYFGKPMPVKDLVTILNHPISARK